jgi:acetyl esterase/lipase
MRGDDGDPTAPDPVDRVASRVQAAGAFFAPTDFLSFGKESYSVLDLFAQSGAVEPSFQFHEADPKVLARILGEISSISHVTSDDPPTILIHGTDDKAVPLQQSQRLLDRLQAVKVDARLVVREGMRHAWPGWEADSELVAQWFDSHLHPSFPQ